MCLKLYPFSHSYHQCFDLEGESRIVVRGIGTCVTVIPSCLSSSPIPVLLPTALQVGSVGNVRERYVCGVLKCGNVSERYVCGVLK